MTEREESRILAHRILDRPNGDPDDDLAMLSRQLLRADERIAAFTEALEQLSRLGNGLLPGNSIGNTIARTVLEKWQ